MTAPALSGRLRYLRPALVAVIVLDVLALAVFAVRLETTTRTTTTPLAQQVVTALPSGPLGTPPPAGVVPVLAGSGFTGTTPGTQPSTTPAPTATATGPTATRTPSTAPTLPPGTTRVARCPIPIVEPTSSGGLQSLIGLAPAFGPFKAEAFAAASAYQPLLQLVGPILARYPAIAPKIEPLMAPFLQAFTGVLDQTFTLISPFYSPQRQAVLEAESKLAAALAPYAQKLVASPLGGCVVELQEALLADTGTAARTR